MQRRYWTLITMNEKNKYDYKESRFYYNNKQYKCYGRTKSEADKKAALKLKALENGEIGISGKMTVKRWCYEWLETYKKGNVIEKTYKDYKRKIDKIIIPEIGNMLLKNVRDVHLQKILNARAGYSLSDIRGVRNTIQSIFEQARSSRLIPFNPAEVLIMPKTAKLSKRRSITDHEREWILKIAETHHAGMWVKMMLYTGLRPGEIIALDWIDIDFKKKLVYVSKAKESGNNSIKAPKTDAGVREVPIPDVLLDDLAETIIGKKPYDPVFTQKTNDRRHTESSLRKSWLNFLRTMDIAMGAPIKKQKLLKSMIAPDLCPYHLRHTFCTDLEIAGVPINVTCRLMGHSDISVTAKIYTHGADKTLKAAADKMNTYHSAVS